MFYFYFKRCPINCITTKDRRMEMGVYKDKKRGTWYVSVYVELRNGNRKRVVRSGFK